MFLFHPPHRHGGGRPGFGRHMRGGFGGRERGSFKYDVLAVLWDGPRHGYDIMLELEERHGVRPSPGSIYPALQMLEDGDFIKGREVDGKRVYAITEQGSQMLTAYRESPEGVAAEAQGAQPAMELLGRGMRALHGLKDATRQLARSRNMAMIERGVEVLDRARREMYAILAEEQ